MVLIFECIFVIFENLVIREWCYLGKIRRCGLDVVGVASLREMSHCGVGFEILKAHAQPIVTLSVACRSRCRNLATFPAPCLHVTMLSAIEKKWTKLQKLSKPWLDASFFIRVVMAMVCLHSNRKLRQFVIS